LIPVHPLATASFDDALDMAMGGGEDYELLFTAPRAVVQRASHALDCPVSIIGKITAENPGQVTVVDASGGALAARTGWNHFRPGPRPAR
ncbi:MAG: thiamine-phosphate kinase, partial [Chloroflexota bacterium]